MKFKFACDPVAHPVHRAPATSSRNVPFKSNFAVLIMIPLHSCHVEFSVRHPCPNPTIIEVMKVLAMSNMLTITHLRLPADLLLYLPIAPLTYHVGRF